MFSRHLFPRRLLSAVCAATLLFAATNVASVHAQQSDLTGNYTVTGTNPSGTTYTGTLAISASKAALTNATAYQLNWTFGSDQSVGLGVLYGNTLGVTFGTNNCVLSIYDIENQAKDGSVTGIWSNISTQNFGSEKVTFDKSLATDHADAQYKVAGTNPDNSTYTGQLTIEGYGLLYDLTWVVGSDTTSGVGLLLPSPL